MKVMFGHKLRYKIKKLRLVSISLKLHQTNWNVAMNNVNVVVDEPPSQIYTGLTIDIWIRRCRRTINAVLCASVPYIHNGGLPVKLTPKAFSQTLPNELECCQIQCKCCCWWTTKSDDSLHLFNNLYVDSTALTHIDAVLCASVPSTPKMAGFQWNWHQKFSTLLWTP